MTLMYANREPLPLHSSLDGPLSVLKWSHSIWQEESCTTEWQAIENARALAFELGVYDGVHHQLLPLASPHESHLRRSPSRSLGFSPDVDVLIGMEDDIAMRCTAVYADCIGRGLFPWSAGLQRGGTYAEPFAAPLSGGQDTRLRSWSLLCRAQTINPSSFCAARPLCQSGRGDDEMHAGVSALPAASSSAESSWAPSQRPSPPQPWAQDLFALLLREGIEEDPEEGPVAYVTSFFISHRDHLSHSEPRPLRLDAEWQDWENGVRLIWEDLVDENEPIVISIVRPDPPRHAFRGTCATVIVHRHQRPDRAAFHVTAVHTMDPQTWFADSAHSAELQLTHGQILTFAQVEATCRLRHENGHGQCIIHAGHHQFPPDDPVHIEHGLGLHIRIPAPMSIAELEDNFARRIDGQQLHSLGHEWNPRPIPQQPDQPETERYSWERDPEDETALMARRPVRRTARSSSHGRPSSTSSSSTSSSTSSAPDFRQTVLFTLDRRSFPALLPWHDDRELFAQASQAVQVPQSELLQIHMVSHRPPDFIQGDLQCLLVQKSTEFRPSPYVRLILLETELSIPNDLQSTPFQRRARWIPYTINRRSLFRILGFEDLCQTQEQICHVWHNNALLNNLPMTLMQVEDGDFIRIYIGDIPNEEDCESIDSAAMIINGTSNDSDDSALFQHSIRQNNLECKTTFSQTVSPATRISTVQQPRPPAAPVTGTDLLPEDLNSLGSLFESQSFIECEEEGPVGYVETWYVHHLTHRVCREPRTVRLQGDAAQWTQDLIDPWQDLIDPHLPVRISLVAPKPPSTIFESILAHVLIEQSSRRDHVVGMISISSPQRNTVQIERAAYSLPALMNSGLVLRYAEILEVCQRNRCAVRVGALPFGLADWEPVARATGFVILVQPTELDAESDIDASLLMQTACVPQCELALQWGTNLPAREDASEVSNFIPSAVPFPRATPPAASLPAPLRSLLETWTTTATIWDGDAPGMTLITWFVDHANPVLHRCEVPRPVRLSDDVMNWLPQILRTWADLAQPDTLVQLHIVDPPPIVWGPDAAPNLLLIANQHEDLCSSLVAAYDILHEAATPTFQIAITTDHQVLLERVLTATSLTERCPTAQQPATCAAWYRQQPILPGQPFFGHNRMCILLHIYNTPETATPLSLLQLRTQLQSWTRVPPIAPKRHAIDIGSDPDRCDFQCCSTGFCSGC